MVREKAKAKAEKGDKGKYKGKKRNNVIKKDHQDK